jgi:hypothetical protein
VRNYCYVHRTSYVRALPFRCILQAWLACFQNRLSWPGMLHLPWICLNSPAGFLLLEAGSQKHWKKIILNQVMSSAVFEMRTLMTVDSSEPRIYQNFSFRLKEGLSDRRYRDQKVKIFRKRSLLFVVELVNDSQYWIRMDVKGSDRDLI